MKLQNYPSKQSFQHFNVSEIPQNEIRDTWLKWIRGFEIQMKVARITDPDEKKTQLLAMGGLELQEIYFGLTNSETDEIPTPRNYVQPLEDQYEKAKQLLNEKFAPKHHEVFERYLFGKIKPLHEESLTAFGKRLQKEAAKCNFGTTAQEAREARVIDAIISFASEELREKLLEKKNLNLDKVLRAVANHESIKNQSQKLTPTLNTIPATTVYKTNIKEDRLCTRCGGRYHRTLQECPVFDKMCSKCGFRGHFANNCRTNREKYRDNPSNRSTIQPMRKQRNEPDQEYEPRMKKEKLEHSNRVTETEGMENDQEEIVLNVNSCEELIRTEIGGVEIEMFIDSGSKNNMIDESSWKLLNAQGAMIEGHTKPTTKKFMGYGQNQLTVVAVFDSIIKVKAMKETTQVTFYVIKGGQQSLLGSTTAKKLKVLKVGVSALNDKQIAKINEEQEFPSIKDVEIVLPIDKNVTPVQQPLRRTPAALIQDVDDHLNELLAQGIIEKVNGYSEWISPLVPIIKRNGDLRLCREGNTFS